MIVAILVVLRIKPIKIPAIFKGKKAMKTMRLAILFSGNGSNLENIYTKMQNRCVEIKDDCDVMSGDSSDCDVAKSIKLDFPIAISSKKSAFGIKRCERLGLKCEIVDFKEHNAFENMIEILEANRIDLVILAGFMRILPPMFNAKFKALNIHPSILPLFKGANAIKESYESDMKIAGVSVHFVSDELDSGALILQDIIYKIDGESLESFEERIHKLEHKLYPKAIIKAISILQNTNN